jgi:uroporphyrinogen-III synthase
VTDRPLAGRRVVVTRSRAQASTLVGRLADLGAEVVELPVIAVDDPPDHGEALARAAHRLASGAYQWVAFTSATAVARLLAELGDRAVPPSVRWAAVGPGTARALVDGGRPVDLVPAASLAEALVEAFPDGDGTVLFPRAETVRGALAEGLRAKGWLVDEVVAYRTVAGEPSPVAVMEARGADAVAFTSSSTVARALELLGAGGVPPVVVSIGPVTTESARSAGLAVAAEARPHTIDGLVDALVDALGRRAAPTGADRPPRQRQQEQQQQQ